MLKPRALRQQFSLFLYASKWIALAFPLSLVVGSLSALFLWSLDAVTQLRFQVPWLLYFLPLAGIPISIMYDRFGKNADAGNNLLMDAIHGSRDGDSSVVIPGRMAPLILISTLITHLFGGSAGREGTAVQMGGAIAAKLGQLIRLNHSDSRILLMAGISAGFAGVFGTPLAGAVFAMEVLAIGMLSYEALLPCLAAAVLSHWVVAAWGVEHAHILIPPNLADTGLVPLLGLAGKVALAAIAFGLVSVFFSRLTHFFSSQFKRWIAIPMLRPVLGGLIILALVSVMGTRDYLGLSTISPDMDGISLASAFTTGGVDPLSWFWKTLYTAITLGSGFKGGEVTPLFFIGASLGNLLSQPLAAPTALFAALGFVAVFSGATNTPLACTIMGIELFGAEYTLFFAIACFVAYLFSGHNGIYLSQRIGLAKPTHPHHPAGSTLRHLRDAPDHRE